MIFLLAPFVGLAVCVFGQIGLLRWGSGQSRLRAILVAFTLGALCVGGFVATFAYGTVSIADMLGYAVLWLLAYLSLAYCYIFGFYNVGESARRVRLLIELLTAGDRGLTLEELLAAYNAKMIVDARLDRLLASGQIVFRGGRYYKGKPIMLWVAKIIVLTKLLFLGSRSEFV